MLKSGVYRIDLGNEWFYVGSASDLHRREREHKGDLLRGDHNNRIMQNVFNKHGAFEFTILGRYPVDKIIEREQSLIDDHYRDPKCANIAPTAGSSFGVKHSDQARANMSASRMGTKASDQARANMSVASTGRNHTDESRAKISAARMGHKHSHATRAKISASNTGRKHSEAARAAISAANSMRQISDATRAKRSVATTAYYARRRVAESAP